MKTILKGKVQTIETGKISVQIIPNDGQTAVWQSVLLEHKTVLKVLATNPHCENDTWLPVLLNKMIYIYLYSAGVSHSKLETI